MPKTADTLRQVGQALYGPSWQTPLAAALGVSDRIVRYWVAEDEERRKPIPAGVWGDVAKLCRARADELAGWAAQLA